MLPPAPYASGYTTRSSKHRHPHVTATATAAGVATSPPPPPPQSFPPAPPPRPTTRRQALLALHCTRGWCVGDSRNGDHDRDKGKDEDGGPSAQLALAAASPLFRGELQSAQPLAARQQRELAARLVEAPAHASPYLVGQTSPGCCGGSVADSSVYSRGGQQRQPQPQQQQQLFLRRSCEAAIAGWWSRAFYSERDLEATRQAATAATTATFTAVSMPLAAHNTPTLAAATATATATTTTEDAWQRYFSHRVMVPSVPLARLPPQPPGALLSIPSSGSGGGAAVSGGAVQAELIAMDTLRGSGGGLRVGPVSLCLEPRVDSASGCSGDYLHVDIRCDGSDSPRAAVARSGGVGTQDRLTVGTSGSGGSALSYSLWWIARTVSMHSSDSNGSSPCRIVLHCSHASSATATTAAVRRACEQLSPLATVVRLYLRGCTPAHTNASGMASSTTNGSINTITGDDDDDAADAAVCPLPMAVAQTLEELFVDATAAAATVGQRWLSALLPHCRSLRRLVLSAAVGSTTSSATGGGVAVGTGEMAGAAAAALVTAAGSADAIVGDVLLALLAPTAADDDDDKDDGGDGGAGLERPPEPNDDNPDDLSITPTSETANGDPIAFPADAAAAVVAAARPPLPLPPLEELYFDSCRSLSHVALLSRLPHLRSVNLSRTDVTDAQLLLLLPALPLLAELHLDWCYHIRDLAAVICARPNTISTSSGGGRSTTGGASAVGNAPHNALQPLEQHKQQQQQHSILSGLRILSAGGAALLNDTGLAAIAAHLRGSLCELSLYCCRGVTDLRPLAACAVLLSVTLPDGNFLTTGRRAVVTGEAAGLVAVLATVCPLLERLQVHSPRGGGGGGVTGGVAGVREDDDGALAVERELGGVSDQLPFLDLLDLSGCSAWFDETNTTGGGGGSNNGATASACGFRGRVLHVSGGGVVRSVAALAALLRGGGGRLEELSLKGCTAVPMGRALPVVARHCGATLTTLDIACTDATAATPASVTAVAAAAARVGETADPSSSPSSSASVCLAVIAHGFPSLTSLDISHCLGITDLTPLLLAPALRQVRLTDISQNTNGGGYGHQHHLHSRTLQWATGTGIKGLLPLLGRLCQQLRTLRLRDCGNMTDADLSLLRLLGRWVTEVDLLGVAAVGPLTVAALASRTDNAALASGSLHKVNLSLTPINDSSIRALARGMGNNLVELRIHGCAGVRDVWPLRRCQRLRVLKLSGTPVEPSGTFRMLARLPHLAELDIRGCPLLTDLSGLLLDSTCDDGADDSSLSDADEHHHPHDDDDDDDNGGGGATVAAKATAAPAGKWHRDVLASATLHAHRQGRARSLSSAGSSVLSASSSFSAPGLTTRNSLSLTTEATPPPAHHHHHYHRQQRHEASNSNSNTATPNGSRRSTTFAVTDTDERDTEAEEEEGEERTTTTTGTPVRSYPIAITPPPSPVPSALPSAATTPPPPPPRQWRRRLSVSVSRIDLFSVDGHHHSNSNRHGAVSPPPPPSSLPVPPLPLWPSPQRSLSPPRPFGLSSMAAGQQPSLSPGGINDSGSSNISSGRWRCRGAGWSQPRWAVPPPPPPFHPTHSGDGDDACQFAMRPSPFPTASPFPVAGCVGAAGGTTTSSSASAPAATVLLPLPPPATAAAAAVLPADCVAARLHRVVFASNETYLLSCRAPELGRADSLPRSSTGSASSNTTTTATPPPPLLPDEVLVREGMRGLSRLLAVMRPGGGLRAVTMDRFRSGGGGGTAGGSNSNINATSGSSAGHAVQDDKGEVIDAVEVGMGRPYPSPYHQHHHHRHNHGGSGNSCETRDWALRRREAAEEEEAELHDMARWLPGVVVTVAGRQVQR